MARGKRSAEKESFWRLALDEHRRSGLTIREYCKRIGASEPSFYAWRKVIAKRDGKPGPQPPSASRQEKRALIPVDVVDLLDDVATRGNDNAYQSPLEVVTPGGYTLRFPQDIRPPQLRALLSVIACCESGGASC
jgi:hypothetical protein